MATYNGNRFVAEQLKSLDRQTQVPGELVVLDDRSTDDTVKTVRSFAASASFPVRVHQNPARMGFADTFLSAATMCTGELIAFCDQDDVWLERKLERCAAQFSDPSVLLVMHSAEVVDASLQSLNRSFPPLRSRIAAPLAIDPWFIPPGFAMVFSASLMRIADWRNRPQSHIAPAGNSKNHDLWIYFLASILGSTVFLADRLVLYRQHTSNTAGAPQRATVLAQVQRSLATGTGTYEWLSALAHQYAQVLSNIPTHGDPLRADRLQAGSRFYNNLSERLGSRAAIYANVGRFQKSLRVLELLLHGQYRRRHRGGFGARSLLKDAALALAPISPRSSSDS